MRVRVPEQARLTELRSRGEPIVYVAWHDRFLLPLLHHRDEGVVAMASRSKDGELAARLASSLGYAVVRGSTGKGGQEALAELAEAMRAGKSAAITVDGPRGPRHVVKTGAMTLARETGAWILPISCHANRAWTFEKSWDRFYLPKPFSIVTITYGTAAKVRVEDDLAAAKERLKLDLDAISTARIQFPGLNIDKREQGNVTVLELRGEVRLGESADALAAALSQVLDESERHVLLDFAQINYIDSTGIGELIGYLERFRDRHRRLALVRPSERVIRLLKLVRLDSVFRIYDTFEEALRLEDQPGRA